MADFYRDVIRYLRDTATIQAAGRGITRLVESETVSA